VQIYTCTNTATGTAWVFTGPEATLYAPNGKEAGRHFAGPLGPTRPIWELNNGSQVVGSKYAAAPVDPNAIPWLLLQAVSHAGGGRMEEVTWIQRLETSGGLNAPTTGCDADHIGVEHRIGYSATYYFYTAQD
jgi:hypothetical protein